MPSDGRPPTDALQAAVESAEVDKMETIMVPIRTDSRGMPVYDAEGSHGHFEDPRLIGDAYMPSGGGGFPTRTTISGGLESPTYTQLENAAMSTFNKPANNSYGYGSSSSSIGVSASSSPAPTTYASLKAEADASIYGSRTGNGGGGVSHSGRQPPQISHQPLTSGIYDPNGSLYGDIKPDQTLTWSNTQAVPYGTH